MYNKLSNASDVRFSMILYAGNLKSG